MYNITFPTLPNNLNDLDFDSVYKTIEYADDLKIVRIPELKKPIPPGMTATSDDYRLFAEELSKYETLKDNNILIIDQIRAHNKQIDNLIINYIKDVSGLNRIVPVQYRDKVYSIAYSDGQGEGYYCVYDKLCELIYIFE